MNTEQIVKLSMAALIICGYGIIIICYMWLAPPDNKTLDAVITGLTTGYLLVLQGIFGRSTQSG